MILVDLRSKRKAVLLIICVVFLAICLAVAYRVVETGPGFIIEEVQYKDYSALNGRFTYKLPSSWKTNLQAFEGNEIIYHNNFSSEDKNIHGFVQVWNLNMPLIEFIKQGKKNPVGIASFKDYTIEDVKINGREGYILSYSQSGNDKKYTRAFEVFLLDKDNTFERFSFFMDENKWKNEYRMFFLNIAASARTVQ